jgi:hypothetical protein
MTRQGRRSPAANSTYPKGGVGRSKDSFVVNGSLVFQIKFCGKSPALRVAAKRYRQAWMTDSANINSTDNYRYNRTTYKINT